MKRVKVILNPYSNRGLAGGARNRVSQALTRAGVEFDLVETKAGGHGTVLALEACHEGYTTIVAAGGDGTVSEVLNGMAQVADSADPVGKLGIIPIGTGNDFADMIGYPRDLDIAAQRIAKGQTRKFDIGKAVLHGEKDRLERYFDNNMGVGFEAQVTLESYKIHRLEGSTRYVAAALRAIRSYPAPFAEVTWEAEDGQVHRWAQEMLLVTIGNSARTGGFFYLTPDAVTDDGLLDIGIARSISRWRVLVLLPKAIYGKHTTDPAITMARCRKVSIVSAEPVPVHLDGEVIMQNAREITVEVQPQRLEIVG